MASQAMLTLISSESHAEQRAEPRHRVLLSAKLVTTTSEHPVKIRNLSATGAMLEGEKLPAAGTDIIIRRGALEFFAAVAWAEDGRCGVQFDQPLSDDDLWMQVHPREQEQVQPQVPHWRPGVRRCVGPAPEEYEFAREWVTPRGRSAYLD